MTPLALCHKCAFRGKLEPGGMIRCTIDGKSIIDHAEAKACPKGYFDWPAQDIPPDYIPSSTAATAGGCGCG